MMMLGWRRPGSPQLVVLVVKRDGQLLRVTQRVVLNRRKT